MPRHPGVHSANLLYHLIARGNNGQKIFLDKEDYEKFLSLLENTKEKYPFRLEKKKWKHFYLSGFL